MKIIHIEQFTGDNFLPTVTIKRLQCYIWWKISFEQPVKNYPRTYENIRKITIGQGHDNTTGCLHHYIYFQSYYQMVLIDLNK